MELKEMIKIMQHYENGGDIEFKKIGESDTKYTKLATTPTWNWHTFKYRIKEQKQKVTIEKWLCRDSKQEEFVIIETSNADKYKQYEKVKLIESYEVEL